MDFKHTLLYLMEVCEVKLEISSVRKAHALKLQFHEQTEIRYNSVFSSALRQIQAIQSQKRG